MDLRQQLIKLSEEKQVSQAFNYEDVKGVHFLKLNTKEGEKISVIAQKAQASGDPEGLTAKMLISMLCDETGELIFKPSDFGVVEKLPIAVTSEMLKDGLKYNMILPNSVEVAEKN